MRNDLLNRVETTDVIIVGGGVIGLSVARALNERGISRVTVIERSEPGSEATHAAGGMLSAQTEANRDDAFFRFSLASRELYPAWAVSLHKETDIDIELEKTGTLFLAFTSDDEEEIERRFQWQYEAGLPLERLSRNETRRLEPVISPQVRSALRFPLDVQVENRRLVAALLSSLAKRRIQILRRTHVKALCVEDGRVIGVEIGSNTLHAPIVVVASGAWSTFLTDSDSRIPPLRIEPVRGQMLCFEPTERIRHVLYSPRGYLVPRRSGRVLVGSTSEHVGFDKNVTSEGMQTIMTSALEIAPDFVRDATLADSWAGLRPRSEDSLPVIGACREIAGLFYATGHYRNGILLAPATGELIADEITTGVAPKMLDAFSPGRFQPVTVG